VWPHLLLAIFVLVLRLPFFFRDVIDGEESSFILMGQAWLDGILPYVELWDDAPPLCYAAYALFIEVFGRWVPGVRIGGALCTWLAAVAALRLGHRLGGDIGGRLAGFGAAALLSVGAAGQATTSEIVAAPALMLGVAALASGKGGGSGALGGAALAAASLVRIELGFVLVAGLVLLLLRDRARSLPFIAGSAVPLSIISVLYGVTGHLSLFIRSMFAAPVAYATGAWAALPPASERPRLQIGPRRGPSIWSWWAMTTIAVLAGVLLMGRHRASAWILLLPLIGVGLGGGIGRALEQSIGAPARRWVASVGLLVLLGAGATPLARAYQAWLTQPFPGRTYGPTVTIARVLEEFEIGEDEVVFLETGHLAYWHLGLRPPTRMATNPSNLLRPELIRAVEGPGHGPAEALGAIFEKTPLYVVTTPKGGRFAEDPELKRGFLQHLEAYELRTVVDGLEVYERRD